MFGNMYICTYANKPFAISNIKKSFSNRYAIIIIIYF
jgi:hypothetical protein